MAYKLIKKSDEIIVEKINGLIQEIQEKEKEILFLKGEIKYKDSTIEELRNELKPLKNSFDEEIEKQIAIRYRNMEQQIKKLKRYSTIHIEEKKKLKKENKLLQEENFKKDDVIKRMLIKIAECLYHHFKICKMCTEELFVAILNKLPDEYKNSGVLADTLRQVEYEELGKSR